jgi:hypothetical protein
MQRMDQLRNCQTGSSGILQNQRPFCNHRLQVDFAKTLAVLRLHGSIGLFRNEA